MLYKLTMLLLLAGCVQIQKSPELYVVRDLTSNYSCQPMGWINISSFSDLSDKDKIEVLKRHSESLGGNAVSLVTRYQGSLDLWSAQIFKCPTEEETSSF